MRTTRTWLVAVATTYTQSTTDRLPMAHLLRCVVCARLATDPDYRIGRVHLDLDLAVNRLALAVGRIAWVVVQEGGNIIRVNFPIYSLGTATSTSASVGFFFGGGTYGLRAPPVCSSPLPRPCFAGRAAGHIEEVWLDSPRCVGSILRVLAATVAHVSKALSASWHAPHLSHRVDVTAEWSQRLDLDILRHTYRRGSDRCQDTHTRATQTHTPTHTSTIQGWT